MLTHTKRTVRVTLDIECYDDLDLESYDWNEILGLEGDEKVYVSTKEVDIWWCYVPVRRLTTSAWGWFFYDYRKAGAVAMCCRLQGYPAPRLISYKIPPNPYPWEIRVPPYAVSTIAPRGRVWWYCYLKFKNFQCLALPPASNPSLQSWSKM